MTDKHQKNIPSHPTNFWLSTKMHFSNMIQCWFFPRFSIFPRFNDWKIQWSNDLSNFSRDFSWDQWLEKMRINDWKTSIPIGKIQWSNFDVSTWIQNFDSIFHFPRLLTPLNLGPFHRPRTNCSCCTSDQPKKTPRDRWYPYECSSVDMSLIDHTYQIWYIYMYYIVYINMYMNIY